MRTTFHIIPSDLAYGYNHKIVVEFDRILGDAAQSAASPNFRVQSEPKHRGGE